MTNATDVWQSKFDARRSIDIVGGALGDEAAARRLELAFASADVDCVTPMLDELNSIRRDAERRIAG